MTMGRLDYLGEALTEEIMEEIKRRRKEALMLCSPEELNEELSKRPGYDGPKYVEKKHGSRS